jgi:hypothetical protein
MAAKQGERGQLDPTIFAISPLFPTGGGERDPFFEGTFHLQDVTYTYAASADHVMVTGKSLLGGKGDPLYVRMAKVRWRTDAEIPVIDKIERSVVKDGGAHYIETQVVLSDFRPCKGGLVAAKVLYVDKGPQSHVSVYEWSSDDLGKSLPSDSDFEIAVADGTKILGAARPSVSIGISRLRLGTYKPAD